MDLFDLLTLGGGLAFFLYGMNVMSHGLEKLAGGKLEGILRSMTASPVKGMLLGALVTAVIQSSSAVTVMLVGLVNSGIMALGQTVGVIMGANIGTTITAWLLSLVSIQGGSTVMQLLKPKHFSLVLAMIGVVMTMTAKSQKKKDVGTIFVGFTVLMYGMEMMSGAVEPLREMPGFAELFTAFRNPLLGVLVGTVLTAIIQSSSASVGILQALSLTGVITYGAALPIIMGQNIGTCITAVISSIGASRSARKVSIIHIAFNVIGSTVFLLLFVAADLLFRPAIISAPIDPAGIAVCHSVFNLCTTALLLPFSRQLVRLADRAIPPQPAPADTTHQLLDSRVLAIPAMAITACGSLTQQMAAAARYAVRTAIGLLETYNEAEASAISEGEETLDLYEDRLGQYLTQISGQGLSDYDSRQRFKMQHVIGDLERLGDHALNLLDSAREKRDKRLSFSPGAAAQLAVLQNAVCEILDITCRAYEASDVALAAQVEPLEQVIDLRVRQARDAHLRRLNAGECTIEAGFLLADVLSNFERISDHCSNIAVAVIEAESDRYDSHDYLEAIKTGENKEFQRNYRQYSEKYAL
ncbi:MAG: Na/Pi cotransporter family protein [Clostridiaceae bacterium]|nr:Na/Pi cotransporter family protein [Clostridia bacterium]MDY3870042.1 Na/Pi cotransporter family protein [Clostridiaceae bacterium]